MICTRRYESPGNLLVGTQDRWLKHPNGDLYCSYCGSMHPDRVMEIAQKILDGDLTIKFSPTDKGYKVYVRQPNVSDASEGGIKFYSQHTTQENSQQWLAILNKAIGICHRQFMESLDNGSSEKEKL